MKLIDLNYAFRQAVTNGNNTALENILACTLNAKTILNVIMETKRYDLFEKFSSVINLEEDTEEICYVYIQALLEGREKELPAGLSKLKYQTMFSVCCGKLGIDLNNEQLKNFIQYPSYCEGVVRVDNVDLFKTFSNRPESRVDCGMYGAKQCMDYVGVSGICFFVIGAFHTQNKETILHLLKYREVRDIVRRFFYNRLNDNLCGEIVEFLRWLLKEKILELDEEDWNVIKQRYTKFYQLMDSDV